MSDFVVIGSSGSSPYQTTEHYLRRVLVGDVDGVRRRLITALERLGYDIIDDDNSVVRGRRGASGWGTFYSSADVLDYPRTLVVKLKPSGEHATRATFDYLVKHPSLSTGEKDILTREAEAISALATIRKLQNICSACGTESTDDSRFCRKCGAPTTVEMPELELLAMAAEVRAGYTSVVASEFIMIASTVALGIGLISILATGAVLSKGIWTFLAVGISLSILNIIFLGFGWHRMRRSLKHRSKIANSEKQSNVVAFVPAEPSNYLSHSAQPPSITEGTTSLLVDNSVGTRPLEYAQIQPGRITHSGHDRDDGDSILTGSDPTARD